MAHYTEKNKSRRRSDEQCPQKRPNIPFRDRLYFGCSRLSEPPQPNSFGRPIVGSCNPPAHCKKSLQNAKFNSHRDNAVDLFTNVVHNTWRIPSSQTHPQSYYVGLDTSTFSCVNEWLQTFSDHILQNLAEKPILISTTYNLLSIRIPR